MQRQILVPLDGSALAESVLPHAVSLARAQGSTLHLLRVITPALVAPSLAWPMPAPVNTERWLEADRQAAREYLNLLASQIQGAGVGVQTTVAEGNPPEIIIGLARSKAATIDAIAMATHGRSGIRRWVLGSVAEKVLHAAPLPLLLVRGQVDDNSPAEIAPPPAPPALEHAFRRILVPLDGSDLAEQALERGRELAGAFGASLELIAVVPFWDDVGLSEPGVLPSWTIDGQQRLRQYAAQYLESIAAPLRDAGLAVNTHWVDGDPADAITAAAERDADLIVMATHGRSGFSRMWLGSVATQVVRNSSTPVLLVRARQLERSAGGTAL